MRGASVTAPFKEAIGPHVAEQDAIGNAIGAVNTVRPLAGGVWEGLNTDVPGLLAPLAGRMALAGARATVLGIRRGGPGRGVRVARRGRGRYRLRSASGTGRRRRGRWRPAPVRRRCLRDPASWDLLVNTTPLGTWPAAGRSPLPDGPFDGRLVYDLVYNPPETRLMADAARAGCDTIGGLDMLVAQAVRQFAWWTGETPSADRFRQAAEHDLARQAQGVSGDRRAAGVTEAPSWTR